MTDATVPIEDQPIPFKAETQQLLNILIHSLYTEREIFLRELISNASDALARLDFIMLTDRDVLDPDLQPQIRIRTDKDAGILIVDAADQLVHGPAVRGQRIASVHLFVISSGRRSR